MFVNKKDYEKDGGKWFWRRKYNSLKLELEQLKEVVRCDLYKKVLKQLSVPQELSRYKRENERLRQKIKMLREEIGDLHDKIKNNK